MTHADSQSRLPTPGPSFIPIPNVYQSPPPNCHDDHLNMQKKLKMHLVTVIGDVLSIHDASLTGETCDKRLRTSPLSHKFLIPKHCQKKTKKFVTSST